MNLSLTGKTFFYPPLADRCGPESFKFQGRDRYPEGGQYLLLYHNWLMNLILDQRYEVSNTSGGTVPKEALRS